MCLARQLLRNLNVNVTANKWLELLNFYCLRGFAIRSGVINNFIHSDWSSGSINCLLVVGGSRSPATAFICITGCTLAFSTNKSCWDCIVLDSLPSVLQFMASCSQATSSALNNSPSKVLSFSVRGSEASISLITSVAYGTSSMGVISSSKLFCLIQPWL